MYYHLTVVKGETAFGDFKTSLSVINYGSLKSLVTLSLSLEKGPSKTHVLKTSLSLQSCWEAMHPLRHRP